MAPFEEQFHHFLEHDLKGLAVQALEEETLKTIERLVVTYYPDRNESDT